METLLVCLLAGYGVWLTVYLWWERRQREHPASQPDVTSLEREDDVPDIIGKSSFKMRAITPIAANPTPQAATFARNDTSDIFSLFICRRNQCTTVGRDSRRSAGTNRRATGQSEQHTHVGRLRKPAQHWLVVTLGGWTEYPSLYMALRRTDGRNECL